MYPYSIERISIFMELVKKCGEIMVRETLMTVIVSTKFPSPVKRVMWDELNIAISSI